MFRRFCDIFEKAQSDNKKNYIAMLKEKKTKQGFTFSRALAKVILKLIGWKAVGEVPPVKKYVMVGYPHTSNWDVPVGLSVFKSMGVRLHWLGKQSLFKGPLGWLMKSLGGIPVNRQKSQNFVDEIRKVFDSFDELVVTLSPEATRGKSAYWRSGFYHIARNANVPIALGFLDYEKKEGGFGPLIYPTGNMEEDLKIIREFYTDKRGKYPQNEGVVVWRSDQ